MAVSILNCVFNFCSSSCFCNIFLVNNSMGSFVSGAAAANLVGTVFVSSTTFVDLLNDPSARATSSGRLVCVDFPHTSSSEGVPNSRDADVFTASVEVPDLAPYAVPDDSAYAADWQPMFNAISKAVAPLQTSAIRRLF
jgi:hypothetical protein